ncbi:MAG: GntR family transcriptional regulator [Polyangiaceae bacterium]
MSPPSARKADEVADDLLRRIVSGDIAVGSLLPRESDLAESYGVGRSVVREANKLLEVHRLVRPTRRRGTEVLDPLCSVTPAVLRAMLFDAEGRVDRAMLAEFLEIRAELDEKMTRLAAERRTRSDLVAIEHAILRIEQSPPGSAERSAASSDLGTALARATKNRIYVMLAHWHAEIAEDLEPLLVKVREPVAEARGQRLLLDAITARDSDLAGRLVAEFHRWANQRLLDAARNQHRHSQRHRTES